MKKTLILYCSNTGDTKKYAEDIASQVSADIFPLKKFKWKKIDDYDIVLFAGWVMGGEIKGLNDFLSHWDDDLKSKDVIVIGNGMGMATPETRKRLIDQNLLDMYHIRFYQFQGSFDMDRLNLTYKLLMKASIKRLEADPNATAAEKSITTIIDNPISYYDHAKVERVVEVIHTIEREAQA